jgi:hypothetical protein
VVERGRRAEPLIYGKKVVHSAGRVGNTLNDGTYPVVVNSMNRAMHRPRPDAKKLEGLRKSSVVQREGRDGRSGQSSCRSF